MASVNSDTIPPVFTTVPSNLSISCEQNINNRFTNWYNNQAASVADNGEAQVFALISLDSALTELEFSLIDCSSTGYYSLGFFAIDSCGNVSLDTLSAAFIVHDRVRPTIVEEATDNIVFCDENTTDSLSQWVTSAGGAIALDNCDPNPIWINYIWTDSEGGSGFGNIDDTIDFLEIRDSCIWSIDVTFFIEDECGNINNTLASFTVQGDTLSALLHQFPNDTTILCHQTLDTIAPIFIDACEGLLALSYSESNTRSNDSLSCSFYDYTVQRNWFGQDLCGNTVSYQQNITVVDTLAPTLNFESIIAKDCDEDLSIIEDFIDYQDNCAIKNVEFSDVLLMETKCITQFDRTYRLEDFCSNIRNANQQLQVEDFSGPNFTKPPQDRIVKCGISNIELEFQNWINNFGFAEVTDNCNDYTNIVRNQPNLSDSMSIINATAANLNDIRCSQGNPIDNIIFRQDFSFYSYDVCGNVSSSIASFILTDTIAPVIPNCPANQQIFLPEEECDIFSSINLPFAIDPCLSFDDTKWTVNIDDVFIFKDSNESIDFNFDIGTHNIEYVIEDCAGNQNSCIQTLMVLDSFPPKIECPQDINIILPEDSCEAEIQIPEIISFSDNCFGTADFSLTLPEGGAFINYELNESTNSYFSKSFNIEFDNITNEQNFFKPVLIIEYALSIDITSRVVLKSEFQDELFIAEKAPCVRQKHRLVIDENQFEVWSMDGNIKFAVVIEENGGNGLIPCFPENLDGPSDIDDFSFFSITLQYTNINPDFTVSDENDVILSQNISELNLEAGSYSINYETQDFAGNIANCNTSITIQDTLNPVISCVDRTLVLTPETDEFIDIILDDLDIFITDNCNIDRISYFPSDFSCQQINRNVPLVVQAWDEFDNFSFCTANLSVNGAELTPSFIGGLCLADTLKLFANVDNGIDGTFNWTGPDNFSSNERNPIITNIGSANSGIYTLNLTTDKGCPFTGIVEIEVSQFLSPEISASKIKACEGDMVVLNSNSYSEIVNYFWYKGVSPNGELIDQTDGPSLQLTAELGTQHFFVVVEGQGCRSNPSNTLTLEVLEIPKANITETFIVICAGDDIVLQSQDIIPKYEYQWTGPDSYNSTGVFPEVIENADQSNAGLYTLVVKNENCFSEPAMVQVIILSPPPKPIIEGPSIFCERERASLTIANIQSGIMSSWYFNGVLYTTINSNTLVLPDIDLTLSGNWTVIVDDGFCTSNISDEFELNVESIPNIGATNNGPVCEGDSIQLTASFIPNASYEWEDPEGNRYFTREIKPLALSGNYSVTLTTVNGCQTIANTNVDVGLRPRVTALSNTSLGCMEAGNTFQLNPTVFPPGNYTYIWSGPDNFNSNLTNPLVENIDSTNLGIYQLIVIENECASFPAQTIVDFTLRPEAPNLLGDTLVCESDNVFLFIEEPIENNDAIWIWFTPQGQITTSTPFLELNNFNNALSGQYSVYQEINNCRSLRSNIIDIDLIKKTNRPKINGPAIACQGSQINLFATGMAGDVFSWITPANDTINNSDPVLVLDDLNLTDSGNYIVFINNNKCRSENSIPFNLVVIENAIIPEFVDKEVDVCLDTQNEISICLQNTNLIYDSIQWINIVDNSIIAQGDENCIILELIDFENISELEIKARAFNQICSFESDENILIRIFTSDQSSLEITNELEFLCNTYFINLTPDIIPNNISPLWSSPDPEILIFNKDSISASFSNLRSGINEIILTSQNDFCSMSKSDTLIVFVLDEIEAADDNITLEFDDLDSINFLANDVYSDIVNTRIISSPQFDVIKIENNKIVIDNSELLLGQYEIAYEICYIECPDICSSAIISLHIGDNNQCLAGNMITPNDDGYNDIFRIPCLEQNNFPDNKLIIFNQWGDEIFKASPYQNNWSGTYQKVKIPAGTYYYLLDLGDGSRPLNGFIVLER